MQSIFPCYIDVEIGHVNPLTNGIRASLSQDLKKHYWFLPAVVLLLFCFCYEKNVNWIARE